MGRNETEKITQTKRFIIIIVLAVLASNLKKVRVMTMNFFVFLCLKREIRCGRASATEKQSCCVLYNLQHKHKIKSFWLEPKI